MSEREVQKLWTCKNSTSSITTEKMRAVVRIVRPRATDRACGIAYGCHYAICTVSRQEGNNKQIAGGMCMTAFSLLAVDVDDDRKNLVCRRVS